MFGGVFNTVPRGISYHPEGYSTVLEAVFNEVPNVSMTTSERYFTTF